MPFVPSIPDKEAEELRERIRSGEYFRQARGAFDLAYHDPMADRYIYIGITVIALLTLLVTLLATEAFLPLNREVPFVYKTQDIVEDVPQIFPLGTRKEDTNFLLKRFLVSHYITLREEYNVLKLDRNANGVRARSTPEVFEEYQRIMDPRNPLSPIALYQRNSTQKVEIISVNPLRNEEGNNEMEVLYDAVVEGNGERKKTRMLVNIAFRFQDITIDQNGGFTPLEFVVTAYQNRRVQD